MNIIHVESEINCVEINRSETKIYIGCANNNIYEIKS